MYVKPSFPEQVWDGTTLNNERDEGVNSDVDPDSRDWDRIAAEVIATQIAVSTLEAEGVAGPPGDKGDKGNQGDPGASNNVPDPTSLQNGVYQLTVTDGVPTWTPIVS